MKAGGWEWSGGFTSSLSALKALEVQTSSHLCSDTCVLHSFRYRLENTSGALVLADRSKTCSSGWKLDPVKEYIFKQRMLLSHHFNALHRSSTVELLFSGMAVPASAGHTWPPPALCTGSGCWLSHLFLVDTSCSAHWQTQQLKVSGLLTAGLTK